MRICVDGGAVFDGTPEQWEDCFFAFPDGASTEDKRRAVEAFCAEHGWRVSIHEDGES